jgi:[ribosomal protein S18]-alanine N-acetyltransferase
MPDPDPVVRPLRDSDVASIREWIGESEPWRTLGFTADEWPNYFSDVLADPSRESDVVEWRGAVGGLSVVRRRVLLGDYLELFAIAPAARRHGVGRALLAHLEARVFARTPNFYLCVSDFNLDAREFYRRQGFVDVGMLDDLLVRGGTEVLMRKSTGPSRRP